MATPEALLLLAATTFVAGVVAHMVWQAQRGRAASRSRRDGRENAGEEDSTQLDTLPPSSSSSSSSSTSHTRAHRRRRPSHAHSSSHVHTHTRDEQETPLGSSLLLSPSPPPSPPLPSPPSPSTPPCPPWISKAGATDSWSEAVTGLEEEARDVW